MLLELTDVTKNFGELHVLSDVSFNLDEGEIVGLIGPICAGKTTLFNLATCIYRPNVGSIRYQGRTWLVSSLTAPAKETSLITNGSIVLGLTI